MWCSLWCIFFLAHRLASCNIFINSHTATSSLPNTQQYAEQTGSAPDCITSWHSSSRCLTLARQTEYCLAVLCGCLCASVPTAIVLSMSPPFAEGEPFVVAGCGTALAEFVQICCSVTLEDANDSSMICQGRSENASGGGAV